jgi:hypothetical protein
MTKCATSPVVVSIRARRAKPDCLPDKLPPITLRHGQALWLLTELGYRGPVSSSAFYEYIKSLRKLGIPFGNEKFLTKVGKRLAGYSYCRTMELTLTLSLRVYHVVPDALLRGIVQYRNQLDRFYRRAYRQRDSGPGSPIKIEVEGHEPIELRGVFLDLNVRFSGGQLVRFGPPKLLSPVEALRKFSQGTSLARPLMPINLSGLSEQVVSKALRAPQVRSGPRSASDGKTSTGLAINQERANSSGRTARE